MALHTISTTHKSLIEGLRAGSNEAWERFFDQYGQAIMELARHRGLQRADCEDILQKVACALANAMKGYDPTKGKFRSYLKTIVIHEIAHFIHQKRRDLPLDDHGGHAAVEGELDELVEAAWRKFLLDEAMAVIRMEFSESDQRAFHDYALEGRPPQGVAEDLGVSKDSVYQAKSRILKRLGAVIRAIDTQGRLPALDARPEVAQRSLT